MLSKKGLTFSQVKLGKSHRKETFLLFAMKTASNLPQWNMYLRDNPYFFQLHKKRYSLCSDR
jgi:hypothetical protein